MADLTTDLGKGLVLANPVIAASGTFGYGVEWTGVVDPAAFGAICVKGLSLRPSDGHPAPRMIETPSGMMNAIGLQNVGVEAFVRDKLPRLREIGATVVVNCFGNLVEEYGEIVAALDGREGVAAIELNVSSPNKREWGRILGSDPERLADVVRRARAATSLPLWVKMTPNVTDVAEMARLCEGEGADALTVANTWVGMAVDLDKRRATLTNVTAGLSGPAIKPLNLRAAWQVARAVSIPVIGVGGIFTVEDALEYLLVGARAVQIGTANLYDPGTGPRIIAELGRWLDARGLAAASEVTGTFDDRPWTPSGS